jgi:glycosyltransferase involved in cell wall biosynthesis
MHLLVPGVEMKSSNPFVSIIIPTHNRCHSMRTLLNCLENQTYPAMLMEVIVVTSDRNDQTVEMLRSYKTLLTLKLFHKPSPGPAQKRNEGAAKASGSILIFLDDDMEPEPQLVEEHVAGHMRMQFPSVIIGYFPPLQKSKTSYLEKELIDWWEDIFHEMRQPNHRFTFRDMLSGNFSIETSLFIRLKGFANNFPCRDDYEFGLRLLKAGVRLVHAPLAVAYHHDSTSVERLLLRKYHEGRADVLLGRQHSDIRSTLPIRNLLRHPPLVRRILRKATFQWSSPENLIVKVMRLILNVAEFLEMSTTWWKLLREFQIYNYWRGVASELQTLAEVRHFLKKGAGETEVKTSELPIDLGLGLDGVEQLLDDHHPNSISIQYKGCLVGYISPVPGAEPLRGIHLRSLLIKYRNLPLLKTMALIGGMPIKARPKMITKRTS